jgi:multiple sugar transport system substrate-binding protein
VTVDALVAATTGNGECRTFSDGAGAVRRLWITAGEIKGDRPVNDRISRREMLMLSGMGLVSAYSLAACGGGSTSGGKVSLRMTGVGSAESYRAYGAQVKAFDAKYPKISVKFEPGGSGANYQDKITTEISGGSAPDIIAVGVGSLSDFSSRGVALDLSQLGVKLDANFNKNLIEEVTIDGKIRAMPQGANAKMIVYDTVVLEQAGVKLPDYTRMPEEKWTWDAFAVLAADLAKSLGKGVYGTEDAGGNTDAFETFIRQRGMNLYKGKALGFQKSDLADWFDYWDKLRKSGGAVTPQIQAQYQSNVETSPLVLGKAPMLFQYADRILGDQPLMKHKLSRQTYPNGPKGSQPADYLTSTTLTMGNSRTKHPEQVAKALHEMYSDPDIAVKFGVETGAPASELTVKQLKPTLNAATQAVLNYVEYIGKRTGASPGPPPPGVATLPDSLLRANTAVAFGQKKIKESVDSYFSDAKSALS